MSMGLSVYPRVHADPTLAEVDEPDAQSSRLEKLASFQLQMILHAFRCTWSFPFSLSHSIPPSFAEDNRYV